MDIYNIWIYVTYGYNNYILCLIVVMKVEVKVDGRRHAIHEFEEDII